MISLLGFPKGEGNVEHLRDPDVSWALCPCESCYQLLQPPDPKDLQVLKSQAPAFLT